jgi:putative ABC transport system permease protein
MVRIDVALLAGLGTALGLAAGLLLANAFFQPFSRLFAENDGAQIHLRALEPGALTLLVALAVGTIVSSAASLEPARRATRQRPLDVLRESGIAAAPARPGAALPYLGLAFAAALALGVLSLPLPAIARVGLIYAGGVGALIAATRPLALPLLLRASRRWQDSMPSIGAFLGRSLTARPAQTALTAGVIAGIVSGLASVAILLSSIEHSFSDWVGSRYRGGLMITAGDPYDRAQRDLVAAETVRAIRATDGVGAVMESVNAPILFRGEEVILFGRDMSVLAGRGQLAVLGRSWPEVAAELAAGKIAVSDAFQRHFGLSPGDRLTLDTARGARSFEISAVVRDYYGASGALHLDIAQFDASWERSGASSVVVWPEVDPDELAARIRRSPEVTQLLFCVRSDDYSNWVMKPFARFLSLLGIVSTFTLILGALAIVMLMTGAVGQRARELAFLRMSGATSGLLSLLVLSDSALIASYGIASGLALGCLCSWPMCAVLTEWLGWSVEWRAAPGPLLAISGFALASALLSALWPALRVRRVQPITAALSD